MITRYTRPEMAKIWADENRYNCWLEVEILAAEAWAQLGEIPKEDVEKIRKNAKFTVERILEIEEETRHDVVAFTRCVTESLGEEKKWVHYGLTSTDVVDTAYGYQLKQANDILRKDLADFLEIIKEKALTYKDTVCMGRTHGVHAEPTTFGLKLALWYSEMKRNIERFERAAKGVEAGKISGAVGTFANIPPEVEAYVCKKLGIRPQEISTQILPRDLHADYISTIALIATSIEKFATEIRGLQKSETREVEEFFAKGQKGSSAMPHKRNPIGSENMAGLRRFGNIVKNLTVFPENMLRNMDATFGLIYSQRVLLKLIDKGMSREKAYDLVQPCTAKAWDEKLAFRSVLEEQPEIMSTLSKEEIDDAFDYHYHIKNVDLIFKRVGIL